MQMSYTEKSMPLLWLQNNLSYLVTGLDVKLAEFRQISVTSILAVN